MDMKYEVYEALCRNVFEPGAATEESRRALGEAVPDAICENTSIADYVWLPLRFEGERVYIDWHDEWRIEDYD